MIESTELFSKMKLEKFISYLIYDVDSSTEMFEDYGKKIENSFKELTAKLESMYDGADKEDNRLFDALTDFAEIHDDIYFEAGFLTGMKLVKNLEMVCEKSAGHKFGEILQRSSHLKNNDSAQSVLKQFVQLRMGTALEESLRQDRKFQELSSSTREKVRRMDKKDFTPEQWELIDEVLSENNEKAAEYGRMSYEQGALDVFSFMKELLLQI